MPHLDSIQLRDFRNYAELDVKLPAGVSVLVGENGQGKTNFLEAIGFLGFLRSFRTHHLASLRRWNCSSFRVGGTLKTPGDPLKNARLEIEHGEKRCLLLNGRLLNRASEFINQFHCVPLVPEDIAIIRGAAGQRRRFLDMAISQINPNYLSALRRFQEVLQKRNALLRRHSTVLKTELSAFDELLIQSASEVEHTRMEFFTLFEKYFSEQCVQLFDSYYSKVKSNKVDFIKVKYNTALFSQESGVESLAGNYRRLLHESHSRDLREGHTTQGPHRSDFAVYAKDRLLSRFGSEGECRMSCIGLRLACLSLIKEEIKEKKAVIMLVDDVLGELDSHRRRAFFEVALQTDQLFLAATAVPDELKDAAAIFHIDSGNIHKDGE